FADLLDRMERPDSGIRTGLPTLDTQLGGLEPGDLMYLCGRPGSGKSALGVTLATAIARRFRAQWQERQRERVDPATGAVLAADPPETLPEHVDIVTLEMRQLQQVRRIVAAATSVNTRVLKAAFRRSNGSVDVEGYQTVKARAYADKETLARTLHIDERPTTLENLRSKVLTAVATRRTSVVLIDQIDLFNEEPAPGRRREADETERISRFSRMLKQLANEANVIIVCLAQLNRNVESRQNKRPMLSDLRSSGRLEQDADIVLGLYRGAYYDGARARKEPNFAQFAELGLLKVRESEANVMVPLRYEGAFTRFSEWPEDWEWPADETRGMER
ncbi:MAG TPA: DnaB-like helicase C-terminal domain-containing protein, partial [Ktedonobacterales bacterium]